MVQFFLLEDMLNANIMGVPFIIPTAFTFVLIWMIIREELSQFSAVAFPLVVGLQTAGIRQHPITLILTTFMFVQHGLSINVIQGAAKLFSGEGLTGIKADWINKASLQEKFVNRIKRPTYESVKLHNDLVDESVKKAYEESRIQGIMERLSDIGKVPLPSPDEEQYRAKSMKRQFPEVNADIVYANLFKKKNKPKKGNVIKTVQKATFTVPEELIQRLQK